MATNLISRLLTAACLLWAHEAIAAPFAFICNSDTNTVTPIDVATSTVSQGVLSVGPGVYPTAIAITPDGTKAYVCNNGSDTVAVIDTYNRVLTTSFTVGVLPQSVAFTPITGNKALVCNSGSNTVSIISVPTNSVSAVRTVGTSPRAVAVSADESKAYVCNEGDNTVSIIDLSTNTVRPTTISVGDTPDAVAFTLDGTLAYVCNYGSSTISVIDVSTDTVSNTISGVDHPTGVVFTNDNSKAIVTNGINNTVTFILTASSTITATPGVGSAPSSIALTPDGTEAYVGNVGDSTISIVDVAAEGVEPTVISVGPEPYGIAMTSVEPVPPPPPPPPPPTPINPPTKFFGEIVRSKHNCTRRAILSMTWNASSTAGVDLYQIFRHRKKIASIPATGPLMFRTCLHSKHLMSKKLSREWIEHVENNYRIRAVASGIPSPLVRLKVTSIVNVDVLPHSGSSSSSCSDSFG